MFLKNTFPLKLTYKVFHDCDTINNVSFTSSGKTQNRKMLHLSKLLARVTGILYNKFFIIQRQEVSFIVWGICERGGLILPHVPVLERGLDSSSDLLNIQKDYFFFKLTIKQGKWDFRSCSFKAGIHEAETHNKMEVFLTVIRGFFCE